MKEAGHGHTKATVCNPFLEATTIIDGAVRHFAMMATVIDVEHYHILSYRTKPNQTETESA